MLFIFTLKSSRYAEFLDLMRKSAAQKSGTILGALPPSVIIPCILTSSGTCCLIASIPLNKLITAFKAFNPFSGLAAAWEDLP